MTNVCDCPTKADLINLVNFWLALIYIVGLHYLNIPSLSLSDLIVPGLTDFLQPCSPGTSTSEKTVKTYSNLTLQKNKGFLKPIFLFI